MFEVCLAIIRDDHGQILLGRKQRGIGTGKIVGVGGKLEPGETAAEALSREVREESGLVIPPTDFQPVAVLEYEFPYRPEWSQRSSVFTAKLPCDQVPVSSEELALDWFTEPPLDQMWADAAIWLPQVLAEVDSGKDSVENSTLIKAKFVFGEDLETIVSTEL